jgi:hypothetical protein
LAILFKLPGSAPFYDERRNSTPGRSDLSLRQKVDDIGKRTLKAQTLAA